MSKVYEVWRASGKGTQIVNVFPTEKDAVRFAEGIGKGNTDSVYYVSVKRR